ncbi:MAG TPA: toast rack family protein [Anaerolineales bacterium]|nr:toast rack family protein [Anaerolineales bacterium]
MNAKIILVILVLALASLACGFSIDLPKRQQAGPEVKESITVPTSQSDETRLTISFGAGKLTLSPGAAEKNLVDGTAIYNVQDLKPEIKKNGNSIEIKQGDFHSLPSFNDIKNEWDLKLSDAPLDLTVQAGAYEGNLELGGLTLKSLTVKDGASNVDLSFLKPNQTEMSILRYETGASNVKLTGLANANFSTLAFSGGAGNYTLDFSGKLQRDAVVTVESGLGDMSLVIPKDLKAVVTVESAAVNINHSSGWTQNGRKYTQNGSGPALTIIVKMAAGNLVISD